MSQRFQIEDLVAQDEHGVVFRARDTETDREVAVRRIFPYGPDGGGLKDEERAAYEAGIQKFSSIQHGGLRTVIAGGCDPVDGMPFLATEWVEGPTLAKAMESGPVPAASIIALMQRALDLCTTLSIAFNEEETVWLETSPSAIIVSADDPQRGFTFWVAPLKWLNEAGGKRGLAPLAKLMRTVLAQPHPEDDPAVLEILVNFSRWLEKYSELATIPQAREALKEQFAPLVSGAPMPKPAPAGPRPVMAARPAATQPGARPTQQATRPAAATARPAVQTAAPVVKPPGMASATQPAAAVTQTGTRPPAKPVKKFKLMPLVTILVSAVCLTAAGFQIYRFQKAKSDKTVVATDKDDPNKSIQDSIARAVAGGNTEPAATTPAAPVVPEPAKPAPPKPAPAKPKPAPAKPAPAPAPPKPAGPVIPANHAVLGTWKYYNGQACTRTFVNENGVSLCKVTVGGKDVGTYKVLKITGDDVIVSDPKGAELHHVLSKDGKTLKIEDASQATKQ